MQKILQNLTDEDADILCVNASIYILKIDYGVDSIKYKDAYNNLVNLLIKYFKDDRTIVDTISKVTRVEISLLTEYIKTKEDKFLTSYKEMPRVLECRS